MPASPAVSVLLPFYNAAPTLARAVNSISAQTFTNWELLLLNDGSTDGSLHIAQQLAAADVRIKIFSNDTNCGIAHTLNTGITNATAPLLARMDADDWSHPERFAKQVAHLDQHPETGLVGCAVKHEGDTTQQGYALYIDWINALQTPEQIRLNRFTESPFAHPSVMFRKTLTDQFGMYRDGDFPEDYELWLRWLAAGVTMIKLPDVLLHWNDLPARLSRTDARYSRDAFYRCKAVYLAEEVKQHVATDRPIWFCGAGRISRKNSSYLTAQDISPAGYIDIDPKKTAKTIGGLPVIPPEQVNTLRDPFIISFVGNRGAHAWIRNFLEGLGKKEGVDFILAA
jgi:glycosyltransferase involved in cell wall biosynthesis